MTPDIADHIDEIRACCAVMDDVNEELITRIIAQASAMQAVRRLLQALEVA